MQFFDEAGGGVGRSQPQSIDWAAQLEPSRLDDRFVHEPHEREITGCRHEVWLARLLSLSQT